MMVIPAVLAVLMIGPLLLERLERGLPQAGPRATATEEPA